jgi:hypothetical protein
MYRRVDLYAATLGKAFRQRHANIGSQKSLGAYQNKNIKWIRAQRQYCAKIRFLLEISDMAEFCILVDERLK